MLNPENEKDLMDAIEALTKEKTIIMIAHRLKTVRHAESDTELLIKEELYRREHTNSL